MRASGATDAGPVRRHNEDRFLIDAALGLAAVADGMGGHAEGEAASAGALAALARGLAEAEEQTTGEAAAQVPYAVPVADTEATDIDPRWHRMVRLRHAVAGANAALYRENRARGHAEGQGMGSTLTGLQFRPELGAFVSFHVGDSRLYRCRDGVLVQLTRDQTAYQRALESGATGTLPPANLLLQAVGPAAAVDPELALHEAREGDLLLLCSDGLHGWVPHRQIEALLCRRGSLHTACAALLELGRQYASRDNVTAVLVRFDGARSPVQKKMRSSASNRAGIA
ncbi:serine/threonine-protein phosphatase [Pseudoduganella umbonata]|nr:serine/threonine-protein phosphatase [Pseudoduganella umbonata]